MLTRQYIRITGSARALLYKRIPIKEHFITTRCLCQRSGFLRMSRPITTTIIQHTNKTLRTNEAKSTSASVTELKKKENFKNSTTSSQELLEKLMTGLSSDYYQKHRIYKNDLLRVLAKVKELNLSSKKQGLFLIKCCTELLPDETTSGRMNLLEEVWNTLKSHTVFEIEHYNELLQVYIDNNKRLVVNSFIQHMAPVKPNITTYELILRVLGEAGDLNQATEVIANMKAQGLPVTENVLNSLIICQGKAGNIHNINEVLTMMKSLKIESSVDTYTAIARALAWNKKGDLLDEMKKAQQNGLKFTETHIMEIVKTLAIIGYYGPIPQVLRFLPEETLASPSISPYMQSVATLLVFQNHPIAALEIYKCLPLPSFGPHDDEGLHGRSLVRDCVKANMPFNVILLITQELMSSGRNPIAIQDAAKAALQLGKVPLALDVFVKMQQLGMPIRPHYFWPILIHTSKSYGQKGIMNTLSTMVSMDVKPDYETIMEYTLPHVSFTSPQNLMKKFQEIGLSASTVLTPMMETLLNTGQVRAASEICELFQGKVDADKILKPLLRGYLISFDLQSTVHVLEDVTSKATNKNKDWVGKFLCVFMQNKKVKDDLTDFLKLVKAIKSTNLRISTSAADFCISRVPDRYNQETIQHFKDSLIDITDETVIDEVDMFSHRIPHPNEMNEESLRAQLNELEAKGMNTRGVLRKLLQQYSREGNMPAAKEIVDKCHKEGVFLSAGMKASIFDMYVKLGELDLAEMTLSDLNKTSPNFTLDEFKIIDFATLMVYRKKIDRAFELVKEQSKRRRIIGGQNIVKNCWRLLDAMAAHGTYDDTRRMFELLTSLRYCKPSNQLLGPLIRTHLKNNNIEQAVNEFARTAKEYNRTPLRFEILSKILITMGDGHSEENFIIKEKADGKFNNLAQKVLNIIKNVHGLSNMQLTLIAALADVGYKKTLRKMFLDPTVKIHPDALQRYCEIFVDAKNVKALENIAECVRGVRHVDADYIYDMILDVHQRDDNTQEALSLYYRMQESNVTPSQKFVRNLFSLLKANKKEIPSELVVLMSKDELEIVVNPS